jgi:hypothetical protein
LGLKVAAGGLLFAGDSKLRRHGSSPIPVYDQPYVPDPNYIWQPGYWAWGSYGYYWVPGTWVPAPQPGYLWTPGYWQGNDVGFHWNPGYWALAVGFYGGVNYGGGYYGNGYDGGQWSNNEFRYNTYVSRVNTRTFAAFTLTATCTPTIRRLASATMAENTDCRHVRHHNSCQLRSNATWAWHRYNSSTCN